MKAWKRLFIVTALFVILIFCIANAMFFHFLNTQENDRQYRVEINRAALLIEKNESLPIDLSQYESLTHVEKLDGLFSNADKNDAQIFFQADAAAIRNFFQADSDYAVREIHGSLYRFDHAANAEIQSLPFQIGVNATLAAMAAALFGILFYIRLKILGPFENLANVPYELSKGNLTVPVKENKNRFFGKFLWGVDLLRENMEQQKLREQALQKEKKTLLLSLSHDMKTPLSAIKLYAKALSKNLYQDTKKQQRIAESINQKADEIEAYLSQITTASREDFLCLDVKNGEFYLSDLIQNISTYYSEKLALVKTEFVIERYRDCMIYGDLNRSVETLQNIIENAVKYGDGRSIRLSFPEDDEGVLVAVKNSGCSLESGELPHIFESFWRGANCGNVRGSGLGLYICRQLMHKMNGDIFAQANEDSLTVTVVFTRA